MRTSKDFRARTRTKILGQQGLPEENASEDNQRGGGGVVAGGGGGCERACVRRVYLGEDYVCEKTQGLARVFA